MDRPRRVPESADEQKMISRLRSASAPAHGAIDFADGVFDVVKGHEPRKIAPRFWKKMRPPPNLHFFREAMPDDDDYRKRDPYATARPDDDEDDERGKIQFSF